MSASSTRGGGCSPADLSVARILLAVIWRLSGSSSECSALAIPSLILLNPFAVRCFSI